MKKLVALFPAEADLDAALNELYNIAGEDEIEVRMVQDADQIGTAYAAPNATYPVPSTGGAAPVFVDLTDLDLTQDERRFLTDRETAGGHIMEVRAKEEYMGEVRRVAERYNAQFAQKS